MALLHTIGKFHTENGQRSPFPATQSFPLVKVHSQPKCIPSAVQRPKRPKCILTGNRLHERTPEFQRGTKRNLRPFPPKSHIPTRNLGGPCEYLASLWKCFRPKKESSSTRSSRSDVEYMQLPNPQSLSGPWTRQRVSRSKTPVPLPPSIDVHTIDLRKLHLRPGDDFRKWALDTFCSWSSWVPMMRFASAGSPRSPQILV